MPILSGYIQLLASERPSDTPDGGGRMTGRVIVDGQSNNLFPDVSELDRTNGQVNLRKCFLGVLTDSTDSYFGAHVIVAIAFEGPHVAVTLFTTKSWTDRREGAKDRIERYLARGVRWPGQLLERQLKGQRAIQAPPSFTAIATQQRADFLHDARESRLMQANLAASIRARLFNVAKAQQTGFNQVLVRIVVAEKLHAIACWPSRNVTKDRSARRLSAPAVNRVFDPKSSSKNPC